MNKKLILHIGTEKTGTTSVQDFLYLNKNKLKDNGIFFPVTPCGSKKFPNHRKLATACFDYGHEDDSFTSLNLSKGEFKIWSLKMFSEIQAELKSSNCELHVLSSEHFSSRLVSESEIQRLHSFLSKIYSEIEVVVYFRRQDQYVVSSYSTLLKSGGLSSKILPEKIDGLGLDYNEVCLKWSRIFGKKSMNVRMFDRNILKGSSIIPDFMSVLNLSVADYVLPERDSNPSLLPVAQEALLKVNKIFKDGVISEATRQKFVVFLEENYSGTPRLPQRDFIVSWYERFSASNLELFREYFEGEGFSEDFSVYPNEWESINFSSDVMTKILFEFFKDCGEECV